MKKMFQDSANIRYAQDLHEDIGKLVPKFAAIYKLLEKAHVESLDDHTSLYSIAIKIDGLYDTYNEIAEWFSKMVPNKKKKAKQNDPELF